MSRKLKYTATPLTAAVAAALHPGMASAQDQDQDQFWPRAHWHYRLVLELVHVKMATFGL